MKYLCKIFCLLIFLFGCNQPKGIQLQFDTVLKLYTDSAITIEKEYFKLANIFSFKDSTIVITVRSLSYTSGSHLIYFISKKTGNVIKKLGLGGRGPDEIMGVFSSSSFNNQLYFYDPQTFKFLIYNCCSDSVQYKPMKFQKEYFSNNLYAIDDNKFLSFGLFGENMYNYTDITTGEETLSLEFPYLPDIPEEKQKSLLFARFNAYYGSMMKQPNNPRFAFYSAAAEYLQIVEVKGSKVQEVTHMNFAPLLGKIGFKKDANIWVFNKKSRYSFISCTVSQKYIYLLYSGNLLFNPDSYKGNYIFIFDWNGNKIKMIELDKTVYSICVDDLDSEIYAFSTNDKTLKNEILHYSL